MKIEYFHASKFGNGATVAKEFKTQMAARDVEVDIHHIREVQPSELAAADLYLFSSPGRFGKPIRRMRRFPAGTEPARWNPVRAPHDGGGSEGE